MFRGLIGACVWVDGSVRLVGKPSWLTAESAPKDVGPSRRSVLSDE